MSRGPSVAELLQAESESGEKPALSSSTSTNEDHSDAAANANNTNNGQVESRKLGVNILPRPPEQEEAKKRSNKSLSASPQSPEEQSASTETATAATADSHKPKRKRRRVPVSCNICRLRKLKCDRQLPCGSCKQLRMTHLCKYESRDTYFGEMQRDSPLHLPLASLSGQNPVIPGLSTGTKAAAVNPSSLPAQGTSLDAPQNETTATTAGDSVANSNVTVGAAAALEEKPLRQYHVPSLYASSQGQNRSLPSAAYDCLPLKPQLFEIKRGVKLRCQNKAINMQRPAEPVVAVPTMETIENISRDRENLHRAKWNDLLLHLPPTEVCDFLRDRFLAVFNNVFHGSTTIGLKKDIDDARQFYLKYVLLLRNQGESTTTSLQMTMPEVHQVALVLLVMYLARLTLSADWNPSQLPGANDDFYLGEGLRLLAMEVIKATNIEFDNNLKFVQLCYFMAIHQLLIPNSKETKDYTLVNTLVQSAYINGLNRDPSLVERIDGEEVKVRRQLWRQVVFVDSLNSLLCCRSPGVNLRHSDTNLDIIDADVTEPSVKFEKFLTQWSLIVRRCMDEIILMPASSVASYIVDQLDKCITVALQTETNDVNVATNMVAQMLMNNLRLRFEQVCSVENNHQQLRTAMVILDLEHKMSQSASDFNHLLTAVAIRLSKHAWFHLAFSLFDPHDLEQCLPVIDLKTFSDVVRLMCSSMELTKRHSRETYDSWRDHIVMSSILSQLESSLKQERLAGFSGYNLNESVPPAQSKWIEQFLTEQQREYKVSRMKHDL